MDSSGGSTPRNDERIDEAPENQCSLNGSVNIDVAVDQSVDNTQQPNDQPTSDSSADSASSDGSGDSSDSGESASSGSSGNESGSTEGAESEQLVDVNSNSEIEFNDLVANAGVEDSFKSANATLPIHDQSGVCEPSKVNKHDKAKSVSPNKSAGRKRRVNTDPRNPSTSSPIISNPIRARAVSAVLPVASPTTKSKQPVEPVGVAGHGENKVSSSLKQPLPVAAASNLKLVAQSKGKSAAVHPIKDKTPRLKHSKSKKHKKDKVVEQPVVVPSVDPNRTPNSKAPTQKDVSIMLSETDEAKIAKLIELVKDIKVPKESRHKGTKKAKKQKAAVPQSSSSSSEQSSSTESSAPEEPGPSNRIPKVSNGRRYQRLAMSQAKHLGMITSAEAYAAEINNALAIIDTVELKLLPTHAYKHFYLVPGVGLSHSRRNFRDIQQRYSELLRSIAKAHLITARDQIQAKGRLVVPQVDSGYAPFWQFNNDLARATPAAGFQSVGISNLRSAAASTSRLSESSGSSSPAPSKKRKVEAKSKKAKKKKSKSATSEPNDGSSRVKSVKSRHKKDKSKDKSK